MTTLGSVLVALAISAPPGPPAAPPATPAAAPAAAPSTPARAPSPGACLRYRVQAERNELAPDAEVAAWATAALERIRLHDPRSPCYLLVRITAGPTRTRGQEDGWVAHVALSARRLQKDGKLVSRERGKLFVEAERDAVVARVRGLVEEWVGTLASPAPEAPAGASPAKFTDGG
jgi:hypothetical protein